MSNSNLTFLEKVFFKLIDINARAAKTDGQKLKDQYLHNKAFSVYRTNEKRLRKSKVGRKKLEKFYELFPTPKKEKKIHEMNNHEFYNYISNINTLHSSFLDFLFDYISTSYINGDLTEDDIEAILKQSSPLNMKKYIDKKLADMKYHYNMAEEIMSYSQKGTGSQVIQEIKPDNKESHIKSSNQFKKLFKSFFPDMKTIRKDMIKNKMILDEQKRIANQRKRIITNAPESLDLVKTKDKFSSQKNQKKSRKDLVEKESKKEEKKKVLIRKSQKDMTPSELIAEKKKLQSKTRKGSSLDIKT